MKTSSFAVSAMMAASAQACFRLQYRATDVDGVFQWRSERLRYWIGEETQVSSGILWNNTLVEPKGVETWRIDDPPDLFWDFPTSEEDEYIPSTVIYPNGTVVENGLVELSRKSVVTDLGGGSKRTLTFICLWDNDSDCVGEAKCQEG